jgi:hypothetical protein
MKQKFYYTTFTDRCHRKIQLQLLDKARNVSFITSHFALPESVQTPNVTNDTVPPMNVAQQVNDIYL